MSRATGLGVVVLCWSSCSERRVSDGKSINVAQSLLLPEVHSSSLRRTAPSDEEAISDDTTAGPHTDSVYTDIPHIKHPIRTSADSPSRNPKLAIPMPHHTVFRTGNRKRNGPDNSFPPPPLVRRVPFPFPMLSSKFPFHVLEGICLQVPGDVAVGVERHVVGREEFHASRVC